MIIKLFFLMIWLGLLPMLVGCLWTARTPEYEGNLVAAYFYGLFTELALFEVLAIPMIFLKCSLTVLTWTWGGCVILLALAAVIKNRSFPSQRRWLRSLKKKLTPVLLVALACMMLQAVFVMEKEHIDDDDAFYLATSTTSVETDSLYRYNPYTGKLYKKIPARYVMAAWPLFLASMSRLSSFHPTVLAHLILPGIVVLWAYMIYALFGARLFQGDKRKQALFLLFTAVLLSFSGYSVYSAGTFLFIRGWQGKAVLAGVGIPALFYGAWMAIKERGGTVSWFSLGCITTSACMFSSMGVVLSAVAVGSCSLVGAVVQKNWRYIPATAAVCIPSLICGLVYVFIK